MKLNTGQITRYALQPDNDYEGWLWMSNGSVPESPAAPSESTSTASVSQRGSFASSSHRNRHSSHSRSYSAMQSSHLSKMSNYTRRWFVLKGQVLFYFHHRKSSQPTGMILLEGLELKRQNAGVFEFSLVADTPEPEDYYFIASSDEEMNTWCRLLSNGSQLKSKYDQLQKKYKDCRRLLTECMEAMKKDSPRTCHSITEEPASYFEATDTTDQQEVMNGLVTRMKSMFDDMPQTPTTQSPPLLSPISPTLPDSPLVPSKGQNQRLSTLVLPKYSQAAPDNTLSPLIAQMPTNEHNPEVKVDQTSVTSSPSLLTQQLRTPPKSRDTSPDRASMPTPTMPIKEKMVYRPVTSGSLDRPKSINISYQQSRFSSHSFHRGSIPDSLPNDNMLKKLKQLAQPSSLKTSTIDPVDEVYLATFTVNLENGYMIEELTKQYQKLKAKKKTSWTGKIFGGAQTECKLASYCGSDHVVTGSDGMECFVSVYEKKYNDARSSVSSLLRPVQNWTFVSRGKTEVSVVKDGKHVEFLVPIYVQKQHSGEFRIELSTPVSGTLISNCFCFVEVAFQQLLQRPLQSGPVVPSTDTALTSSMGLFANEYAEKVVGSAKIQAGNIVGQMFVNMHPMTDYMLPEPRSLLPQASTTLQGVQQLYFLPTKNYDQVLVQEILLESQYPLYVASAYAQYCQKREASIIHAIENVGLGYDSSVIQMLSTPDRTQRQEVVHGLELFHNDLLEHYQDVLGSLLERQSACDPKLYLRRSVEKKDLEVQWMALNCNLHEIMSHKDNDTDTLHDSHIVTVGAFASHAMGFGASSKKQDTYTIPVYYQASMDGQLAYEKQMYSLKQNIETEKHLSDTITQKVTLFQQSIGIEARSSKINTVIWNCVQNWVQHIMDSLKVKELESLPPQFSGMYDLERQKDKMYTKVIPLVTERLKNLVDDKEYKKELLAAFHQGILFASTNYSRLMETLSFVLHEHGMLRDCLAMTANTCYPTLHQQWQATEAIRSVAMLSRKRADACLSQALGALVSGFVRLIMLEYQNDQFWYNLEHYGYLAHFESLLSTQGDEMGMLQDSFKAIKSLEQVRLRVHQDSGPNPIHIFYEDQQLVLSVQLPDHIYYEVQDHVIAGTGVRVVPVMFSQGINEMQALANLSGDTSLQDNINVYGYTQYEKYVRQLEPNSTLVALMQDLKAAVGKSDEKKKRIKSLQTNILHLSEQVFRILNLVCRSGTMHVSCKSAKDRTSMAVTLQHVLSMFDSVPQVPMGSTNSSSQTLHEDPLHKEYFHVLLGAMRSERGVRLHNVERNFDLCVDGERGDHGKFAFNSIQLQMLPVHYKPDPRVTNASLST